MSDSTSSNNTTTDGNTLEPTSIWDGLNTTSDPQAFAKAWLDIVCAYIDANIHLAVVVLSDAGSASFAPVGVWPEGALGTPTVTSLIESAISQKQSQQDRHTVSFHGQNQQRIALASPLVIGGKVHGAVALDIEHVPQVQLTEVLRQLDWGLVSLEALVHRTRRDSTDRLVTVLDLVATSLHHGRFQAAATAVATELAGILQCERVSIGFLKGGHTEVRALSHSASFGKKTNIIRDLGACMDEAIDQQVTVTVPPLEGDPLQVTRFHERLLSSHGEGAACTIPFADADGILGAITLERPMGIHFDAATRQLCEHAASLLGPVLESRRRDDRWLVTKAVDSLKQHMRNLVGPQHTALKLGSFSALFALIFFSFASGDYRVTADATLEGAVQRAVAVPIAGFIAEANARAGDVVKAGDVLFTLDDSDLRLERLKWVGQRSQYKREYSEALAQHNRAQVNILGAQLEQAEAQIALVEEQLHRIRVTAPFDSFVVSGDLSQSLGAPVERGDILFEVAPLDEYRVILKVDERDIAGMVVGQGGQLALTGMPGDNIPIVVAKITPVATAEEGRNFFEVEAGLADDIQPTLRPGMQGIGKIYVGERKLIWIWTHKLTQWWRMFLWSWWP